MNVENNKHKLYLLCETNDEDYSYADYTFFNTYEEARQIAIKVCKLWDADCDIKIEKSGFMIVGKDMDSFYVTEIKEICYRDETHLLVWHHGYDGVDFDVLHQGTLEYCQRKMKEEIQKRVDKLGLTDECVCDNVVDTGDEWEVFDVVEIRQ